MPSNVDSLSWNQGHTSDSGIGINSKSESIREWVHFLLEVESESEKWRRPEIGIGIKVESEQLARQLAGIYFVVGELAPSVAQLHKFSVWWLSYLKSILSYLSYPADLAEFFNIAQLAGIF